MVSTLSWENVHGDRTSRLHGKRVHTVVLHSPDQTRAGNKSKCTTAHATDPYPELGCAPQNLGRTS